MGAMGSCKSHNLGIPICGLVLFATAGAYRRAPLASRTSTILLQLFTTQRSESINSVGYIDECVKTFRETLRSSYIQFAEDDVGRDKEGSWIIQDRFENLQEELGQVEFLPSSRLGQLIKSLPWPAWINCTRSNDAAMFDLTIVAVPSALQSEPRSHPAGTILIYKRLYGEGRLKSYINGREIKTEELEDDIIVRLAGLSRVFEGTAGEPAALIELALYPPRRLDEGFGAFGGFSKESESRGCELFVDPSFISEAFVKKSTDPANLRTAAILQAQDFTASVLERLKSKVGGLAPELAAIVRRILCSRQLSADTMKALGITHTRGLLLYGPPGSGKTLVARELAKALNATEPKIVNGPEILSKFVGEAERNIRELFEDAEAEWAEKGSESALHVIVFDELDSIARVRGSFSGDGTGVRDSVVNQLLSKIDGAKEVNNFLVIGLTNRRDLIDPALLRPGRFEVQLKISEPDELGRKEILQIITRSIKEGGYIDRIAYDEWIDKLAKRTPGWTGAELAGLVRSATSHALSRFLRRLEAVSASESEVEGDANNITLDRRKAVGRLNIEWDDFLADQKEVRPR